MLESQTVTILGLLAQLDNRFTMSAATADLALTAWHGTIGDLDYGDAVEAVFAWHRRPHDRRIMTWDVVEGVAEIRLARFAALPPVAVLMADVDPADPEYNLIRRARQTAAMDRPSGRPVPAIGPA